MPSRGQLYAMAGCDRGGERTRVWHALRRLATATGLPADHADFDPVVELYEQVRASGEAGLLLEAATAQRVSPMLVWLLRSRDIEPPADLNDAYQEARFLHASSLDVLGYIDDALAEADIPWAVIKGPALSAAYPEPSTRPYLDIDLLIRGRDLERTIEVLDAAGIEDINRNWGNYLRYQVAETPLWAPGIAIDLHWHLVGLGERRRIVNLDIDAMIARRQRVQIGSAMLPTLDPADFITHVCLHAGLSGATRLGWLLDVRQVIEAGTVDWAEFVFRARSTKVGAMIGQVLDRARVMVEADVQAAVPAELCPAGLLAARRFADRLQRGRQLPEYFAAGALVEGSADRFATSAKRMRAVVAKRRSPGPSWNVGDADGPLYWDRPTGGPTARADYYALAAADSDSGLSL